MYRRGDSAENIFFLRSGQLTILEETQDGERVAIDRVEVNEPIGELEFLLGGDRHRFARADSICEFEAISFATFEQQIETNPELMQHVSAFARRRMQQGQFLRTLQTLFGELATPIFAEVEPHLRWVYLDDGDWLEREAGLYILIAGRVRGIADDETRIEIEPCQTIGETALIVGGDDEMRYQAMHDSTLVLLDPEVYQRLIDAHPAVFQVLSNIAIQRLRNVSERRFDESSLITIALIPISDTPRTHAFCTQLSEALAAHGATCLLSSNSVDAVSDRPNWSQTPKDNPWSIRLTAWLDEQEGNYRFVLYKTDTTVTPWTRRAILRAENIVLVGEYQSDHTLTEIERELLTPKTLETVRRRVLALVYPYRNQNPSNTRRWIDPRNLKRGLSYARA